MYKTLHLHESDLNQTVNLRSGCFTITTPVVGQMCHVKEVGYWLCFPVKHLVAVRGNRWRKELYCFIDFFLLNSSYAVFFIRIQKVPPYHALSLKEIGAVPGGAFRAF